jgi:hypothetical protein
MEELAKRRGEILQEFNRMGDMRKGVLNATYQKVTHKDGEVVVRGPYFRLSRKGKNNKTLSWSIPTTEAKRVQAEVDSYRRFRQLADEFVNVCDEMSALSHSRIQDDAKKN